MSDQYPVHPCAAVFPMLPDIDLAELAARIKTNGLQHPIVLIRTSSEPRTYAVLDGRNRLAALERLGVQLPANPDDPVEVGPGHVDPIFEVIKVSDPAAYVIDANIHRRHMTKEKRAKYALLAIRARQNDLAKVARSFSPTPGKKGGSTKDPDIAEAVAALKTDGVSERTIRRVDAQLKGRIPPKSTIEPTVKVLPPALPSTYQWLDDQLTECRQDLEKAWQEIEKTLKRYELLDAMKAPDRELTPGEQKIVRLNILEKGRRLQKFGENFGSRKSAPKPQMPAPRTRKRPTQRSTADSASA